MKKIEFAQAEFIKSALSMDSLPKLRAESGEWMPEIAFVGKSNVGKSSLINHLLNRKGLARVSATPGKTQTLNFFTVDNHLALVDLPGYGYAKVRKDIQEKWAASAESYFMQREELRLILLLVDSRRGLSEDDAVFANWARHANKNLLIVFTKADKSTEKEKAVNAREALKTLGPVPFVHYTIKELRSRKTLIENINRLLDAHGATR